MRTFIYCLVAVVLGCIATVIVCGQEKKRVDIIRVKGHDIEIFDNVGGKILTITGLPPHETAKWFKMPEDTGKVVIYLTTKDGTIWRSYWQVHN